MLLDFGDAGYQGAWSLRIQQSLTDGGWTGVDVADAGNAPEWSGTPVDPRTGAELEPDDRATYLAQALSLVHAAMRTQGFFLLAQNGPPEHRRARPDQLGRRPHRGDGVRAPARRGMDRASFGTTSRCSASAGRRSCSRPAPDPGERRDVYGLAGYLLVATPEGAYGLAPGTAVTPLYDLDLGAPDPDVLAEQVGEAWTRTYPNGAVAVNPSDLPTELSLGAAGTITLPAGRRGDRRREPARDELLTGRAACLPRLAGTAFVYYRPAKPGRLPHDFM